MFQLVITESGVSNSLITKVFKKCESEINIISKFILTARVKRTKMRFYLTYY